MSYKSLQQTLEPLKIKQKEVVLQNPNRTVQLGSPNLGTFWIIDFVTVTFGEVTGTNKTKSKTELKSEFIITLFEDNFVLAKNRQTTNLPFVEPEESQTLTDIELSFNFPQPPVIQSGHNLVFEYKTTFSPFGTVVGGISSLDMEEGKISIGYTLVDDHPKKLRTAYAQR